MTRCRQVQLAGDLHHAGFYVLHLGQRAEPVGTGEADPLGQGILLCLDAAGSCRGGMDGGCDSAVRWPASADGWQPGRALRR